MGTFIGTPAGRDWFYKIDLTETVRRRLISSA
jgi:hypothetical protein